MVQYTPDFTLEVEGIKGVCPAGEVYAKQTIAEKKDTRVLLRRTLHSRRHCQIGCQHGVT